MRTTFSIVIDTFFIFIVSFFVSNIILYYFCQYPYTIIFSLLFSIIATIIYFRILKGKNQKSIIKFSDKKLYENTIFEMNLKNKNQQEDDVIRAIERQKLNYEKKNGGIFIKEKNIIIFCNFGFSSFEKSKIIKAYNSLVDNETAIIISQGFSLDAKRFCSLFNDKIYLMEGQEFFYRLKKLDCLPKLKNKLPAKKRKKFDFNYMQRKNAKRFLLSGISFLILSNFVPIKIYYFIFGCMFLVLALVVRLFGKDNSSLITN